MADAASSVPPSGIKSLQWSDLWKGLIKSTSGLIVGVLIKTIQDRAFPPYEEIAPLLEATVYFLVGYLGINYGTNNVGQLFKADAPTVTVGEKELKEELEK